MANYKNYAQFGTARVDVSTSAQLNAAVTKLAASGGGTVRVDPDGGPYNLYVKGIGSSSSPVLIVSDGTGRPDFTEVTIKSSKYLTISGIDMDTSKLTGRGSYADDLRIENSSFIEVVDSNFKGSARGYLTEATSTDVRGNVGAYVVDSNNVRLDGNSFTNHFFGVKMVDTVNSSFTDNEVTQFQADAFSGGGLQTMRIAGNWLHDALGSTQTLAHSDFIQISRASARLQNQNIEIAYNLIDAEDGGAAQGIQVGTGGTAKAVVGLSIHDNVIHTALPRGIGVDKVLDLEVYNNTVLWDEASAIQKTPGSVFRSYDARILISGAPDAEIYDNVASWIRLNGVQLASGGYQIQYKNPGAPNYVDRHIVNLDGSGNPDSYDLSIKTISPLFGAIGAALSSGGVSLASRTASPAVTEEADLAADTGLDKDVHLYLVDSATDRVVRELSSTDTVSAAELAKGAYNLEAVYDGGAAGSVQFWLDGSLMHTENGAPYAAYSNTGADFWDEALPEDGTAQELEVRVFSDRNGGGTLLLGDAFDLTFDTGDGWGA